MGQIVLSPSNGGKLLSYYCFFSRKKRDYTTQGQHQNGEQQWSCGLPRSPSVLNDRGVTDFYIFERSVKVIRGDFNAKSRYIRQTVFIGSICEVRFIVSFAQKQRPTLSAYVEAGPCIILVAIAHHYMALLRKPSKTPLALDFLGIV
jgi:hypothetical protein